MQTDGAIRRTSAFELHGEAPERLRWAHFGRASSPAAVSEPCLSPSCGSGFLFRAEPAFTLEPTDPRPRVKLVPWNVIDALPSDADVALNITAERSSPLFIANQGDDARQEQSAYEAGTA